MYAIFRLQNNGFKRKIAMDQELKAEIKKKDEELMKIVGKKLKQKRNQSLKTLEEVEEEANLGEKHLGKIERGQITPLCTTYFRICDALDINGHDLFKAVKEEMERKENRN